MTKRPVSVAYAAAGSLYERLRARGESQEQAMADAVRLIRTLDKTAAAPHLRNAVPKWARGVIDQVAFDHGVDPALLRNNPHATPCVMQVRTEAVYVVRAVGRGAPSFAELGAYLGRDHSSLSVADRAFRMRMEKEDILRTRVEKYLTDRGFVKEGEAA